MHPNTFLRTFWQMEIRPQVFVAMSFDPRYAVRFDQVIAPAIRRIKQNDIPLLPYRVDISKTGDSILTDIMNGIAHSRFILADLSSVGKDSISGRSYRNGNVMYEVGVALACRQPEDVLLIRDDKDDFLFDVSTIPHMHIDFGDPATAMEVLFQKLYDQMRNQAFLNDARVRLAAASLTKQEIDELRSMVHMNPGTVWAPVGAIGFGRMVSIPRLLDKGIIRVAGVLEDGAPAYITTPLGYEVTRYIKSFQVLRASHGESSEKEDQSGLPPG